MLPAQLEEVLGAVLAAERAKVEKDEAAAAAVTGGLSGAWLSLIGADSTAAAARTDASAGRKLYQAHVQRGDEVSSAGDVAGATALIEAIRREVALPSALAAGVDALTFTGGVSVIARDSARDAADLAVATGRGWMAVLKASPFLLVGLAVLAVVLYARRGAARA